MIIKARHKMQDTTAQPNLVLDRCQTSFGSRFSAAFCLLSSVFCILLLAGCAKQQQYQAVHDGPQEIYLENVEKIAAMKIAEDVLGRMHFAIEKADPNIALIKTRPLPAAQFFEFWRKDNVGRLNSAEANLHSIQRVVQLNIAQENNNVRVICSAQVYRLSLPQQQSTSTTQAYRMFSESSPDMQRLILRPEQKKGMAWTNLGQDKELATEILKRIEKQSSR